MNRGAAIALVVYVLAASLCAFMCVVYAWQGERFAATGYAVAYALVTRAVVLTARTEARLARQQAIGECRDFARDLAERVSQMDDADIARLMASRTREVSDG